MAVPIRVGVVGCGAIATAVHIRVLRRLRGVQVTALADPDPAARAWAGRLVPGAAQIATADELLTREDIDAVVIAAPSGLHAKLALATLATGRHIYLEKPIATTLDDGRRVAAAARHAGVVAVPGFNWRFQPLVQRAHELLCAGMIGKVRTAVTVFSESAPVPGWKSSRRDGGGVLLDLGSHHFDLIRWLLDAEIEGVDATLASGATEHDSAVVTLRLTGDRSASSSFSLCAAPAHSIELTGEKGVLRIDRSARTLELCGVRARTATPALLAWRARCLIRPHSEPSWGTALRAFVDRINGATVDLPTFEDGLRSLETVIAAEHSAGVA